MPRMSIIGILGHPPTEYRSTRINESNGEVREKLTRRGLERRFQRAAGDNFVNETVLDRLRRGHEVVAVGVLLDLLDVLAGMMREDLVQDLSQPQRFTRVNLDIAG